MLDFLKSIKKARVPLVVSGLVVALNEIGVTEEVSEVSVVSESKGSFSDRVRQLRESSQHYKRYQKIESGPPVDEKKFKKAYINIERATKAYKEGDFKKGDTHPRLPAPVHRRDRTVVRAGSCLSRPGPGGLPAGHPRGSWTRGPRHRHLGGVPAAGECLPRGAHPA